MAESESDAPPAKFLNRPRAGVVLAVVLTLACLLPVLVVIATRTGRDYLPVQDLAVMDLRVRDVWSVRIPLVGPYSKGFNHPGPAYLWLIALPSLLAGKAAWATLVGSALIIGAAIVATARVAWRVGGITVFLAAMTALMLGLKGTNTFLHTWNPNAALAFYVLFLLLAWSVTLRRWRDILWLVVVGSFIVQAHIGYVLLVLGPAALATLLVARDVRNDPTARYDLSRQCVKGLIALVVLWIPAVVQQVLGPDRNVSAMIRYARETGGESVGLRQGLGLFAADFTWHPSWLGGWEPRTFVGDLLPSSLWWLAVPAVLLAAAWLVQRRRPMLPSGTGTPDPEPRALALVAAAAACGAVALAQVRPPVEQYLFLWRSPVAVLLVVTTGAILIGRAPGGLWPLRVGCGLLVVLIATHSVQLGLEVGAAPTGKVLPSEPIAREILGQISAAEIPDDPFLVRAAGDPRKGVFEAVVNEMDRRGEPVRLPRGERFKWGDRVASPYQVDTVWYVTTFGSLSGQLRQLDSAVVVAETSPLPPALEEELTDLQADVWDQLDAAGSPGAEKVRAALDSSLLEFVAGEEGIDLGPEFAERMKRIAELNARVERSDRCRCAVIAVTANDARDWHNGR